MKTFPEQLNIDIMPASKSLQEEYFLVVLFGNYIGPLCWFQTPNKNAGQYFPLLLPQDFF